MPIVYAGGRYHVAVGSVGAAVLFLKHLALFGSCRLNTLTRCLSSLLDLRVRSAFSRGLPGAAQERPTDNADEQRPFVAGSVVGDG